ncbi:MAG: ATP phosphoribosyltransferase regulatory subunit [Chloroflexota bacterium]
MPSLEESAPIRGARDLSDRDMAALHLTQERLQGFLAGHGYERADVPVLERSDLYLRKLGSRVAARMFSITDQRGERLSMRPEFTGSVIRSYIRSAPSLPLPVRWQYCGPVFRDDEAGGPDVARQFTQLGVELIGAAGPRADAEVSAAACGGVDHLGLGSVRLIIGHSGIVPKLLEGMQLSDRVRMFLAGHLDLARQGVDGVNQLRAGLDEVRTRPGSPASGSDSGLDAGAGADTDLMPWLLGQGTTRTTGRRTTEEIVRRFRTKAQGTDNPAQVERALALVVALSAVQATPEVALARGRSIVQQFGLDPGALDELGASLESLQAFNIGSTSISVDLGLTRALGYYTGVVFEVFSDRFPKGPLGGGGRYDGLVRALGGDREVPALGYAFTVERLLEAADRPFPATQPEKTLVVPRVAAALTHAVRMVEAERMAGSVCLLELEDRSEEARRAYCAGAGIARMVLIDSDGTATKQTMDRTAGYAPAGAS